MSSNISPDKTPDDTKIELPEGSLRQLAFVSYWFIKSKFIIWMRRRLSHVFAFILAIFTVIREIADWFKLPEAIDNWFKSLSTDYQLPFVIHFILIWEIFIIVLALMTIAAAIWEFKGNKLATSHQERRFIAGMNKLMETFDVFHQSVNGAATIEEAEQALLNFESVLLEISSWILCGKYPVCSALMIYQENGHKLVLDKAKHFHENGKANLSGETVAGNPTINPLTNNQLVEFVIDLNEARTEMIGPAIIAFKRKGSVIHLPKKLNKIGFIYFRNPKGKFQWRETFRGWYPSEDLDFEDFRSVLSTAVSVFSDSEEIKPFGVLNFTTQDKDLFTPRDYTMALCFASLVAQAIYETNLKKTYLTEANRTGG
jgi:hypothetical protein